jgi:hypothetical protein
MSTYNTRLQLLIKTRIPRIISSAIRLTTATMFLSACMSDSTSGNNNSNGLAPARGETAITLFLDHCVEKYAATGTVRNSFENSEDFILQNRSVTGESLTHTHRFLRLNTSGGDFPERGYSFCSVGGRLADPADFNSKFRSEVKRRYGSRVTQAQLPRLGLSQVYLTPQGRRIVIRVHSGRGSDRRMTINAGPTQ